MKVYAIEDYTSQLANGVVYKEADMSVIVNGINKRGGKYDMNNNCYKLGNLRIYIETKEVWTPAERDYDEYPIEQFLTDARKQVAKLRRVKRG